MKRNQKVRVVLLSAIICLALIATPALGSTEVTLVGTVMEGYQIMGEDQQIYDIADDEKGNQLGEMVEKKVKVTGVMEDSEGVKVLRITSYEIMGE